MKRTHLLLTALFSLAMAWQASATPVPVQSEDLQHCDPLPPLPNVMDELGTSAVFPADEFILASASLTTIDACLFSSPDIPNVLLRITNMTKRSFTDLHYVRDMGTTFANYDGRINGFEAVRIDNVGINRPLIAEIGGVLPLVFEPGETWEFVLDDWSNGFGQGPADLGSIGVPSPSVLPDLSSGSIVALPVPEPASGAISIAVIGTLMFGRRRS